jgi:hypothetical protein
MDARQRAAKVAADVQRSRAIASAVRGVRFMELGVFVQGAEVRIGGARHTLKGACAGVMDVKAPDAGAVVASVVFGGSPRVGTIFVAFADGTRHDRALKQASRPQMQKVDEAVRQFRTGRIQGCQTRRAQPRGGLQGVQDRVSATQGSKAASIR